MIEIAHRKRPSLKRERRGASSFAHASGSETRLLFTILKWILCAGLLASILFAHGCHGDEDHELFGSVRRQCGTSSGIGGVIMSRFRSHSVARSCPSSVLCTAFMRGPSVSSKLPVVT